LPLDSSNIKGIKAASWTGLTKIAMPIVTQFSGHRLNAPPDARDIVEAANLLQVREITFFRLAYRRWFGHEASERAIESPFMTYLFTDRTPVWVRHFAREVLRRDADGDLDPTEYGLPPRPPPAVEDDRPNVWGRVSYIVIWGPSSRSSLSSSFDRLLIGLRR